VSLRKRAIAMLIIQCLLVSSIAAIYLYERVTRPRVWTRVVLYDPELPMRGRYLALQPLVDACDLVHGAPPDDTHSLKMRSFRARLVAHDGKLMAEAPGNAMPASAFQSVTVGENMPCERGRVWPGINFFVPENARSPFPLRPEQELWAEVTVPPSGPPRAIQLAVSDKGSWRVLQFD
jgi:hypothetical protein